MLIVTGIFIIAAMSLNLLLGYTGQLSLGHVALLRHRRLRERADVARLRGRTCFGASHRPRAVAAVSAFVLGIVVAGLCG